MSAADQKRLPRHALLSDEDVERYDRLTQMGVYKLVTSERFWQERQPHLQRHGYLLRPRYSPDWQPSWIGTNLAPMFCEDSIISNEDGVIDARRAQDNALVVVKSVRKGSEEIDIAQFFASSCEPDNHCISILDVIPDPLNPEWCFITMPFLRACNDPDFEHIGEVVDFVDQTLEGLAFMHRHRVAHRDISVPNIMMDARPLYPDGYHPVHQNYTRDALYRVSPLSRLQNPVRYYFIDFGLSTRFPPDASSYVVGEIGRDTDVPELSDHVPYDAFKVDIFSMGNVYHKEFEQKFKDTEFLVPLIDTMKHEAPSMRPSIDQTIAHWKDLKKSVTKKHHWRLSPKAEQPVERIVNDAVDLALRSYNGLWKYGAGMLGR
ncbi:kinase-like domain-containing protein [Fomes fomentarius]|nr:kinase-like domain-containing protein [Fomes fomentarius]